VVFQVEESVTDMASREEDGENRLKNEDREDKDASGEVQSESKADAQVYADENGQTESRCQHLQFCMHRPLLHLLVLLPHEAPMVRQLDTMVEEGTIQAKL